MQIFAACSPGEVRVAVVQNRALLDYAISRPGRPDGVGDVLRGRVMAHLPAMAGAFVALPGAEGFLPDSAGGAGLAAGSAVQVRITRAAQGGKGPRLRVDGVGEPGPPALLSRGPGAVERMALLYPNATVTVDDMACAAALRPVLGERLAVATHAFDDAVMEQVEALSDPDVPLPGGMRASIHPTPALVAIDVDGAGASADRRAKGASQMAGNLLAVTVLMRQVRLRNLSGAILVDMAGMAMRRRQALAPAFEAALALDPLRPRLLGFSPGGLAEISRPRIHPPLHELQAGPHAAGLRALRAVLDAAAATPSDGHALRCPPDVAAALSNDPVALPDLARRTGRPLVLRPDPSLAPGRYGVEVCGARSHV